MNIIERTKSALKASFSGQYIRRLDRTVSVNYKSESSARYSLYIDDKYYASTDSEDAAVNFLYNM